MGKLYSRPYLKTAADMLTRLEQAAREIELDKVEILYDLERGEIHIKDKSGETDYDDYAFGEKEAEKMLIELSDVRENGED